MEIMIIGIFLIGVVGLVIQVLLSIQKNKVLGLIIPCLDLVCVLVCAFLSLFIVASSIVVLYGVIFCIMGLVHTIIYGIARVVRKSMNTTEIKRQTQVEDVKSLERNIQLKEEMKKMEINDL